MPRSNRITSQEFPFQITGRCINRDWFEVPLRDIWPIYTDHLYFCAKAFEVEIFSFVLMQNHFHLLAKFPENNLSKVMCYFMGETSRQITKNANRINRTYGTRFHSSLITKDSHFRNVYKYNYRNPVKAGIVPKAELYEFSTLSGLLGQTRLDIPVVEDLILFENPEKTLAWINRMPDEHHELELQKALRGSMMKFALDKKKRQSFLENGLL